MHWKMFSSIPVLNQLDASTTTTPSCDKQKCLWSSLLVEYHCFNLKIFRASVNMFIPKQNKWKTVTTIFTIVWALHLMNYKILPPPQMTFTVCTFRKLKHDLLFGVILDWPFKILANAEVFLQGEFFSGNIIPFLPIMVTIQAWKFLNPNY